MPGTESLSNVDLCVLTAQNAAQARHFESQVRHLQATGVLPPALRWAVVPDPPGPRLGTGGATLHAVCAAVDLLRGARRELTAEAVLAGRRVLVIHSGGLSQRLPQFSALGKVFAPLPGSGLSSRPLLVQVLANLGQLADRAEDGVFVACGDALMQCDVSGLALPGAHAAVFVAPAAPEQAARHGVYQWDTATGLATAVYQKPSPAEQRESGLLTRGRAWLDTGVLYLSTAVTSALIGTLGAETRARPFRQRFLQRREHWEGVELYKDVTGAMVPGQTGDSTLRRALERFQLHVLAPDGARFLHFGTTAEFIQTSCDEATTSTDVTADGWLHPEASIDEPVEIQTSLLEDCGSYLGPRSIVQYAHCSGALHVGGDNHVFGLRAEAAVTLPPETLLYQAPIRSGNAAADAIVVLGIHDNPKDRVEGGIGFLGGDLAGWAARRGVDFEELWPHAAGDDRSLWNARIFPAGSARQVIELLPWLLGGEDEARAGRERWRALPRVSMDDVRGNFDLRRWRRYEQTLREDVVARNLAARLLEGGDLQFWLEQASATRNISGVAQGVRQLARRERAPLVAARLWQLSAQLGRTDAGAGGPVVEGDNGAARDQQRAFRSIQTAVGLLSSRRAGSGAWREPAGTAIKVTAPVRIDLAGGWTDTPPQAIERGGTVLNLAITLDGVLPVQARVTVLDAPRIELAAQDHRMELTLTDAESLCEYSELSSAFALHKAAICELGLVPNRGDDLESYLQGRGGGFRLETSARVPMGSGLGTSSILGAAVLAALGGLVGPELDLRRLSRQVLQLEQRLTSGGGWQDQVGALTGGFKVARTPPGRDQTPTVEQLAVPPDVVREFEERLVVYFTGLPRLARNVLQRVVARYLLRDPAVEAALAEMPDLVERLRLALLGGRLDEVGECLSRSWHLNQQIEPTASNPAVERLFEAVKPYAAGAKLAGAGGGGFIIVLAREPRLAEKIRATIREAGGAPDGEYQARVSTEGISTRKGAA